MANPTLKFAIVEFNLVNDSNPMKQRWKKLQYQDITPPLPGAGPNNVATFNSRAARAQWSDFQNALLGIEPDWLYISGHHGRQLKSDWDGKTSTWNNHCLTQKETGFFNNPYDLGTWHGRFNGPNQDLEVYMTSARDPVDPILEDDNPFFAKVHSACKGVILIACNSLAYFVAREAWAKHYPNALVMGMLARIDGDKRYILPFLSDRICSDGFYQNPPATPEGMAEYCYKINRGLGVSPGIIRLQRPTMYSFYDKQSNTASTYNLKQTPIATYPNKK